MCQILAPMIGRSLVDVVEVGAKFPVHYVLSTLHNVTKARAGRSTTISVRTRPIDEGRRNYGRGRL